MLPVNSPQSIVSLAAGKSQLPLLRRAKEAGFTTIAIDRKANAPGFEYADICINESTLATKNIIRTLRGLPNCHQIEGVLARTTGQALYTAVAISREFNLPGLTSELVRISTEKSALREFCNGQGFPMVEGIKATENIDPDMFKFPVIVKPDFTCIGKANIRMARNRTSILTYAVEAAKLSNNQQVIIESFIEGIDATCLCWVHNGEVVILTWWDELVGIREDDRIIGLGVSVPSVISGTSVQQKAEEIVSRLVSHFPTVDALILISFRISMEGTPYLIEIHSDLGGDLIAETLLPAANPNFDFFDLAIQVATGRVQKAAIISCKPTTMIYSDKQSDYLASSSESSADNRILNQQSLEENLSLMPKIVSSRDIDLSIWPLHLEWLSRNRSAKEQQP